jgi:cbb3-type cytochrome oxidase subunit 3
MEWQTLLPQIGFTLFAIAFAVVVWRVFNINKQDLERVSRMPLNDD